jgi:hypothetical protein
VGGNLLRQAAFDDAYNSSNIEDIEGRHYALIACAGAPGEKWRANREPERDAERVSRLTRSLARVSCDQFVLISTVDVYPRPVGVDEATPIEESGGTAYGRNRLLLERFASGRFATTVVRLPGLFGPGLKKNVIFDFLHRNNLEAICPESVFQFYPLSRLWEDIERVRRSAIPLMNFATEPTSVATIAREAFGLDFTNRTPAAAARYDMRTRHASAFGRSGPYLYDAPEVLGRLRDYVRGERGE